MGKFRVEVTTKARSHIDRHRKSGNKPTINKIEKILIELSKHPETGIGKPEKRMHDLTGLLARTD